MRILTFFFTLTLLLSFPLIIFGLSSTGKPSCVSSFSGGFFEGSSDSTITEKWEWKNLDTLNPTLGRSGDVEPASIFGKVTTEQGTKGTGVVGVSVEGNVSGPSFSMTMGPQFEINSITLLDYISANGDAWGATTRKTVKSRKSTSTAGAYTLNGSGTVIAVSGGGGIVVLDTGFSSSGTVKFSFSPTADPKVLNATTDKDLPKAYECRHSNCEAALPNRDYHLVTCSKSIINHHGGIGPCRNKYYICQNDCINTHVSDSTPPSGNTPSNNPPPPSYHACGDHETSVSGDHSYGTYTCGSHSGYACQESNDHKTYISSCTSTNSDGNTCNNSSAYYECSQHSHTYPPSLVACGGTSYTGCSGASSRTAHHVPSCSSGCGNGYWTCSSTAVYNHETTFTCRRPGCGSSFTRCTNSTCTSDWGTHAYHWASD